MNKKHRRAFDLLNLIDAQVNGTKIVKQKKQLDISAMKDSLAYKLFPSYKSYVDTMELKEMNKVVK